uniref:Uncharacterized protein n=1 Tax=Hyaloperonospora arabidopsidis (strain Emoy2) TaxID=559515 RepID=M4BS49_HYAAE
MDATALDPRWLRTAATWDDDLGSSWWAGAGVPVTNQFQQAIQERSDVSWTWERQDNEFDGVWILAVM